MPVRGYASRPTELLRPGSKPASHDKRPKSRWKQIQNEEGQKEGKLLRHIFTKAILARQSSGRNFRDEEYRDCHCQDRKPPQLRLISKRVAKRGTEQTANYNWYEK